MAENHHTARFDPPVRYTVRFAEPGTHYVTVDAVFPFRGGQSEVELFLPVWAPGSYLVREFARQIEAISACDASGTPLALSKTRKNRWKVETGGATEIRLSYRVYCREMSVRTNWVEDGFALVNGPSTFIGIVEDTARPHEVSFVLPAGWNATVTGLPEAPEGQPHHYVADDYDMLVDSPVLCGNPSVYRFELDGIPHVLANEGEAGVWDGDRSAADAAKIARMHRQMWTALPYRKYAFLNLLTEGTGGLEHRNSMCLMASRWASRSRRSYLSWLNLVSHEFFHVWNVKRLRPVELGPFDYENENHTRSLWIAEGITDYYAPLAVRRAGLSSADEYLGWLSDALHTLQTTPGRLVQSLEQASFDAWIKFYRPDENSVNTSVSYYNKGAVVAWLLDARIRRASSGERTLEDLMRTAIGLFSGARGFTAEEFKSLAAQVAGEPLDDFFRVTVESPGEVDYQEALDWFGLRLTQQRSSGNGAASAGTIGAATKVDNGRLVVTRVPRDTPAWRAGIDVDDEILAIDDFRIRPEQLSQRLESYRPGTEVSILVARRDMLRRIGLRLGEEPGRWQLEIRPDATEAQHRNLVAWIG